MLAGTLDIEKGVGEDAKEELVDIAGKKPHGNGTLRWLQLLELRATVTCSTNAYRSRTTRLLFGPNNSLPRNFMEKLRLRENKITNYGNLGAFSIHKYQNCAGGPINDRNEQKGPCSKNRLGEDYGLPTGSQLLPLVW